MACSLPAAGIDLKVTTTKMQKVAAEDSRRAKPGKHKSTQEGAGTFSAGPSALPQSDFVELVWENGQVMMQGASSKAKKNTTNGNLFDSSSQHCKFREKGMAKKINSEMGKLGMIDSMMNDFHLPASSDPDEHDDMAPWLSYQIDEQVPQNYSSDFFMELSDVTANELSTHTTHPTPLERRNHSNRAVKNPHPVLPQNPAVLEHRNLLPARPNFTLLDPAPSLQSQTSVPSFKSRVSDANNNATAEKASQSVLFGDSARNRSSPSCMFYPDMRMQPQEQERPLRSTSIMNFSQFTRPAALVKSNHDGINAKAIPDERVENKDKVSARTGAEPTDPTHIESTTHRQNGIEFCSQPALFSNTDKSQLPMSKPLEILQPAEGSRNMGSSNSLERIVLQKQVMAPTVRRTVEPVNASSVCSGNSIDRASNDPTYSLKRKHHETEDTEYPSEDVEEESVGIKKAAANRLGSGSKRSRAAEVHNLSERRRRDRINEKMRALQELIPNCNKVDKASMLDEAIEYLKTLQLQLQMMSMGPGLCMPPMMLPHATHMPRFSPMGVGIGMGMGYGLGMLDMNGNNASSYPLTQMPPVLPGSRFPGPPVPGLPNLNGNPMSNLPMFGLQGQGVPMSMSGDPAISFPAAAPPPIKPAMDLNTFSSGLPNGSLDSAQCSQSNDPVLSVSLEGLQKSSGLPELTMNQTGQAANDRDQASNNPIEPSNTTDIRPGGAPSE